MIDPDSDTKKKTTMTPKSSKLEPDTKSVDTPKTDVDLENKTEDKAENTE